MDIERVVKGAGIAFIIWWVFCAILGIGLTGLVAYILYRIAVLLSA